MLAYVIRRLFIGLAVLLVATFLVYLFVAFSGDPLALLKASPRIPRSTIVARSLELHLNDPVIVRYWLWLSHFVRGDFGKTVNGNSVASELVTHLAVTLRMVIAATVLSVIIAVVVGVISAIRQYSIVDYVSTFASYLFISTPVFVIGVLLKNFVAVKLNQGLGRTVFYTVGEQSAILPPDLYHRLLDYLAHSALPVLTLTLITYAAWSRYQRSSMLDVIHAEHVLLARAKGISPRRVLIRHVLRNALIPVVTVVALDFAAIIGGAVVTEIVFSWNGMGQWLYNAILNVDVNIVVAWMTVTASMVILFNIIADVLYAYLDPRIRYG